ncbi:MAG TPA: CPBP family intramembrane glutamic endopeptidase [Candidatus Methylacidiphilales bacterium]
MTAFLEHHPKLLPALFFAATLAAQAWLLLRFRKRGWTFPKAGRAPELDIPWEAVAALVGAVIAALLLLRGLWFEVVALVGVVVLVRAAGRAPLAHFGLGPAAPVPFLRAPLLGLALALAVSLPLQLLAAGIEEGFRHFGLPTPPEPAVDLFHKTHGTQALLGLVGFALVLGPLCEEAFFRGFLQPVLKARLGRPALALGLSAAAFAAIHGHWVTLLPLFGFGLVQGLVYECAGSLLLCFWVHFWFNAITVASLLAEAASSK